MALAGQMLFRRAVGWLQAGASMQAKAGVESPHHLGKKVVSYCHCTSAVALYVLQMVLQGPARTGV